MVMAGRRSLMKAGGKSSHHGLMRYHANHLYSMAYMINENSIQFNIVSKNLGCERMAFFLNEAAGDISDIMMPVVNNKAKL